MKKKFEKITALTAEKSMATRTGLSKKDSATGNQASSYVKFTKNIKEES